MPAKQITDLAPADSFDEGDLLLIRKTGLGVDRNINYANFIKSISSSLVGGFIAQEDGENENTVILNHSSGVTLNRYYNGMKISFVSNITSTDIVKVRVGGLEFVELLNLTLKDSAEIKQGDYIEAIYAKSEEGQGAFYRTNNYATNPKPVVVAEEPPQNQAQPLPDGQAQEAPVPVPAAPGPQEIVVSVGPNGRFKTIKLAIRALTAEYGKNGSNKPVIMTLQDDYIVNETINLKDMNLSWITITSTGFITINIEKGHGHQPFFDLTNVTSPIIAAKFLVKKVSYFAGGKNSTINLKGANFNLVGDRGAIAWGKDSIINIESSTFDFNGHISEFVSDGANNNAYNFSNSQFNNIGGTFFYNGFSTNDKTLLNIDNCQIKSTSTTKRVIEATGSGDINITNTTITGASSQLTYFYTNKHITFKNCTLTSSVPSAQSVVATGWSQIAQITIDGGSYQTIVANRNSTIKLLNSPTIASRSTASNGKIIQG